MILGLTGKTRVSCVKIQTSNTQILLMVIVLLDLLVVFVLLVTGGKDFS